MNVVGSVLTLALWPPTAREAHAHCPARYCSRPPEPTDLGRAMPWPAPPFVYKPETVCPPGRGSSARFSCDVIVDLRPSRIHSSPQTPLHPQQAEVHGHLHSHRTPIVLTEGAAPALGAPSCQEAQSVAIGPWRRRCLSEASPGPQVKRPGVKETGC